MAANDGWLTIGVKGLKELDEALKQFPVKIQRTILAKAVAAGAAIVRKDARARCPKKTGKLARSIRLRKKRRARKGQVVYLVGPRLAYGHLVEFGTAPHVIRARKAKALGKDGRFGPAVKHPGATAKPYLRPAFDANTHRVIEAMRLRLARGIDRELAKSSPPMGVAQ